MTAQLDGPVGWIVDKPKLDPEMVTARSRQIAEDHQTLFLALHAAAANLAMSGDSLGLLCFATGCKTILAAATALCGDTLGATDILE